MPIKNMSIINLSDLLDFTSSLGYTYSQAIILLHSAKLDIGHICSDHYSDTAYNLPNEQIEARNILKQFMNKHQLQEFYICHRYHEIR